MVYAIANQKGGVGKSTTAAALIAGLTANGYRCLGVDLDAQRNLSYIMGADQSGKTTLGVLTGEVTAAEAIQHTAAGDIIPAHRSLSGADAFIADTGKEYKLEEALEPIKNSYDFIVIDCPPALGVLTVNALTAADQVIIPAQADVFSLQGITELSGSIRTVKKYCNRKLAIAGILFTRYSSRSVLSREVSEIAENMAQKLNTRLFRTVIREAVTVREAQMSQQSIFAYAPKAKVCDDYRAFVKELLEH